MVRRLALMFVMVLILSGCKAGAPASQPAVQPQVAVGPSDADAEPPVANVEPPAKPAPPGPAEGCLNGSPAGNYALAANRSVGQGICAVRVDSEDLWVDFFLSPEVSVDAARSALVVTAPTEPEIRFYEPDPADQKRRLQVHFFPGTPGEKVEVRLSGSLGASSAPVDFGFAFQRVATPTVIMEWRPAGEGEWRQLGHVTTLPRGATDLRFRIVGQVTRSAVEDVLRRNGIPAGEWLDGDLTTRTLAAPPGHILLNLDGLRTGDGLATRHSVWELFFGSPPRVVALDPVTGGEQVLGEAPHNVAMSNLSPDGRWALLVAVNPDNPYAEDAWVVDTGTGQVVPIATQTYWPFYRAFWSGSELLLVNGGRVTHWRPGLVEPESFQTQGSDYVALSPDGLYLVGFTFDFEREGKYMLAPGSIVLYDVAARTARLLAVDKVAVRIPHSSRPVYLRMEFTADGTALMIEEPIAAEGGVRHWVKLDLETEAKAEAPEFQPFSSPDWLGSPAGYQVQRTDKYSAILVKAPDGTVHSYGEGLVIGWRSDGSLLLIRWENGRDLRQVWSGE